MTARGETNQNGENKGGRAQERLDDLLRRRMPQQPDQSTDQTSEQDADKKEPDNKNP